MYLWNTEIVHQGQSIFMLHFWSATPKQQSTVEKSLKPITTYVVRSSHSWMLISTLRRQTAQNSNANKRGIFLGMWSALYCLRVKMLVV